MTRMMAPYTPFLTEHMFQNLRHLLPWTPLPPPPVDAFTTSSSSRGCHPVKKLASITSCCPNQGEMLCSMRVLNQVKMALIWYIGEI